MAEVHGESPRRWQTWRALTWRDRAVLMEAAVLLPLTSAALRLTRFQRVYTLLAGTCRPSQAQPSAPQVDAEVRDIARLVGMASRHTPFAGACLQRSLVLWWMLRRRGIDADVRFGARKSEGQFLAHAWVERDGRAVGDDDREAGRQYAAMPWVRAGRGL